MKFRATLRRWHTWLGWLVGLPMLFWTVSGLIMVARPIEEVRGEGLLRDPAPIALTAPTVAPRVEGRAIASLALEPRAAGPVWVVRFEGKPPASRRADPATGRLLAPLGAADAVREVGARYTGKAKVESVTRVDPRIDLTELRRPLDGWRVRMDDGTHFFVDRGSGEIVAGRTRFWRLYDWMWGLHIMDLQGRSDTHNPWVISFSLIAVVMVILALVLLPAATFPGSRVKRD